jgi:hypothetical protein
MTSQVLAGLLLRQPFQPFMFIFADHTEVRVERPEQVQHDAVSRIVTVVDSYDRENIIDLDRVSLIMVELKRSS